VLHRFTGKDGEFPYARLTIDHAGIIYGATGGGGNIRYCKPYGCGVIFKLAAIPQGGWSETVLHHFVGHDGADADNGLIFDLAGNLFGTTVGGGDLQYCQGFGCGTVFKLTPNSEGGWDETVLHHFVDDPGAYPRGGLIFDARGNLYGTTSGDGVTTFGSVFEITP